MARKLPVVDTIEKSFNMLFDRLGYILLYLPFAAVYAIFVLHIGLMVYSPSGAVPVIGMDAYALIVAYIVALVVSGSLSEAAVVIYANAHQKKKKMSISNALKGGLSCVPRLFLASIAVGLIVGAGCLALIVPGIYLAVRLMLFTPACVLDGDYGLKRSWKASENSFWRLLAIFVIVVLVSVLISLIPIAGVLISLLIIGPVGRIAYTLAYLKLK